MVLGPAPMALATIWFVALVDEIANSSPGKATLDILSRYFGGMGDEGDVFVILLVMAACLVSAIPSLLYALAMEFAIAEGLDPASWRFVGVSSFLGALCGMIMAALSLNFKLLISFMVLGGWVGFALGFIITISSGGIRLKRRTRRRRRENFAD